MIVYGVFNGVIGGESCGFDLAYEGDDHFDSGRGQRGLDQQVFTLTDLLTL